MPPMLLHQKRAVVPLAQAGWKGLVTQNTVHAQTRSIRSSSAYDAEEQLDFSGNDNEFILSILRAKPSIRDTKSYLASFGPRGATQELPPKSTPRLVESDSTADVQANPLVQELIDPVHRRTALVKLQGPFTDRQLESIARGLIYLEKLGLVSVIVMENDEWKRGSEKEREDAVEDAMRTVAALEAQGARARPVLDTIVHLGPHPTEEKEIFGGAKGWYPEAHAFPTDLVGLKSALRAGEIPVLPALALDSFCRSVRVSANDVVAALTRAMVEAGKPTTSTSTIRDLDMTPLRLMIVNRQGGVPSYARAGLPHLLVNVASEYEQIRDTFLPQWQTSHPTALANLSLSKTCLSYMPRSSSAIMVSHRSPSSLIANLITNKPAQSSSLPHALLSGTKKLTPHTPTLFRHGLPIRILRRPQDIDKERMTALLEQSFRKTLDYDNFWQRVDASLDFAIVAGDYQGGAIVTRETLPPINPGGTAITMTYLDKFAVLPSHQGDGTVDFLWVTLHDESYGLGTPFARNFIEGSRQGVGEGIDLVWRSRGDNPVNKWYYERSSGHLRMGDSGEWVLFWCDAENRLRMMESARRASADASTAEIIRTKSGSMTRGPSFLMEEEKGRLDRWADVVAKIPSSWRKS